MASVFGEAPKVKKKARRVTPKEENLQAIKDVIQDIGDEDITVEQFVSLISQHTGDRGAILSRVMSEDLNSFRKMVIQVYDTMTQDVSDVLANEQMELAKMYDEKHRIILNKVMQNCKDLKEMNPNFNFEQYYANPERYVKDAYEVPELPEDEEVDTVKRQMAYHRLQWLQSEGERLKAENTRLQKRLTELKNAQRKSLKDAVKYEVEAEQTNLELSQAENSMQEKLEDISQTIHDRILEEDKHHSNVKKKSAKTFGEAKKKSKKVRKEWEDLISTKEPEENWNIAAAQEIETSQLTEHVQAEVSRMTISATSTVVSPLSHGKKMQEHISKRRDIVENLNASLRDRDKDQMGSVRPKSPEKSYRSPERQEIGRRTETGPIRPKSPEKSYRSPERQAVGRRAARGPKDSWRGFY